MILGVYRRLHPKAPWGLVSVAQSVEVAKQDKIVALEKAKKDGKAEAEVAILTFDTATWMPEWLQEAKEDPRLLYN